MSDKAPTELKPAAEDVGSQALSEALRSSFVIVRWLMRFGYCWCFLARDFSTVGPQENAIILRMGRPVGEGKKALLGPGLHFSWPKPIDDHTNIPISSLQIADATVGWYMPLEEMGKGNEPQPRPSLNPANTSYTLTSDTNIIHVTARLHYRISDPIRFHFDFADGRLFVTNALNNAILFASAQFTVDDILTKRVAAFRETVASRVKDLIEQQQLGVSFEQLDVQAIPPRYLQGKFNEVTQASVKRDDTLNKADSYATETLGKARAEAESRINTAQAARNSGWSASSPLNKKNFSDMLPQYQANPELFLRLRQMSMLERVRAGARDKIIQPHGNARELRLILGREPAANGANKFSRARKSYASHLSPQPRRRT